jgi:hypothetical protein
MFVLNPNIQIQLTNIPHSNARIWIIDDVVDNFHEMLDYCFNKAYFNPIGAEGTLFPGVRDEMPKPYYQLISALFNRLAMHSQGRLFKRYQLGKSWLSKVTVLPENLDIVQTMPHFDSLSENHMAAVHYLNENHLGGTHFYRYKGSSKIHLSHDDKDTILKMVEQVKQSADERRGYINDSDALFEKVFSVDAKPNRLILYAGNIMHSANISSVVDFDKSSPNNRTTINSFFTIG